MTQAMAHELNAADRMILDSLLDGRGEGVPWGRNLPQNLAAELDYSRQYVQNRLQLLQASGYVENIGGGCYEFREDPREEEGQ